MYHSTINTACCLISTLLVAAAACAFAQPLNSEMANVWRTQSRLSDADWHSMGGLPGANGDINAIAAAPDGSIYVAGSFTIIGDIIATNIAKWNGSTWANLGAGMNNDVLSLAADGAGNLYAGGYFSQHMDQSRRRCKQLRLFSGVGQR